MILIHNRILTLRSILVLLLKKFVSLYYNMQMRLLRKTKDSCPHVFFHFYAYIIDQREGDVNALLWRMYTTYSLGALVPLTIFKSCYFLVLRAVMSHFVLKQPSSSSEVHECFRSARAAFYIRVMSKAISTIAIPTTAASTVAASAEHVLVSPRIFPFNWSVFER